jgi:hypothetical protein
MVAFWRYVEPSGEVVPRRGRPWSPRRPRGARGLRRRAAVAAHRRSAGDPRRAGAVRGRRPPARSRDASCRGAGSRRSRRRTPLEATHTSGTAYLVRSGTTSRRRVAARASSTSRHSRSPSLNGATSARAERSRRTAPTSGPARRLHPALHSLDLRLVHDGAAATPGARATARGAPRLASEEVRLGAVRGFEPRQRNVRNGH